MRTTTTKPRRRTKGTGTVLHRSDGLWEHRLDLGRDPTTGKRRRRSFYAHSRSELQRKVADETARGGGTLRPREGGTIGGLLDAWLSDGKPNWTRSTYALNKTMVEKHLKPVIGNAKLATFDADSVRELYRRLRTEPLSVRKGKEAKLRSPAVIFRCAVISHTAFEGQRRRHGGVNPFSLVDRPAYRYGTVRTLTKAQVQRFIAACRDDRFEALWLLMVTAGLRIGEALALEWRDLDLNQRVLFVERGSTEVDGVIEVGAPKTARSQRTVPLTRPTVEALRRRQAAWEAEGHRSPATFTTADGGKLYRRNLRRRCFAPLLERAGLPQVSFHSLRHACATYLAEARVALPTILQILGQTRPGTALAHYLHSSRDSQRAAAITLERYLRPKRAKRTKPAVEEKVPELLAEAGPHG
jgi:integrase